MEDNAKREFYVREKYDIKWALSLAIVTILGSLMFQLMGLKQLAGLELLVSLLFWLLFWGSYRTLNIERERERARLERKKSFGI